MPAIWPDRVVWQAAQAACSASRLAPLSARRALFAAGALDGLGDAAFSEGWPVGVRGDDILRFRAALAQACPAMDVLMDLCRAAQGGPWLRVGARAVEPDALTRLPVADLMVGLYSHSVPRLELVTADGGVQDMQALLLSALDWWAAALGPDQPGLGPSMMARIS